MPTNQTETELNTFPVIHTNRLDLVEIRQQHLKNIYNLFSDENVTRFYNLLPLTVESDAQKFIDWYQNRFKEKLGIRWSISLKGEQDIIGTIGFNNFTKRHKANIGYDLQPDYWNKGIMTEALRAVINFGFNQLEINRMEAEVMQGNVNSEKLLLKLNFLKEGVLREWMLWNDNYYDMSMFSLLKSDSEGNRKQTLIA